MLLSEKREKSKQNFLKKELEELYTIMKNRTMFDNSTEIIALNNINSHFRQFAIFYDKTKTEYCIENQCGNGCSFILGTTYMSRFIDVKLYDIKHQFLLKEDIDVPYFLYHLLVHFDSIEKDYLQLVEYFDKLEKTATIIRKWVSENFSNTNYNFKLLESENKMLLSISFRGSVLSIPIYYKRYKQILPYIFPTLKMYENIIVTTKIKVLIS